MNIMHAKKKKSLSRRNFERRVSRRRIVDLSSPGGIERRELEKPDQREEERRRLFLM